MTWQRALPFILSFLGMLCSHIPLEAGVPENVPVLNDVALQKFLKSLYDHVNTLECLSSNPNGNVLGHKGELKCATISGCNNVCMNTSDGPNAGTAWSCFCPSATCPGGSDTQVQYNDVGSCGGDEGFTFNETTNLVDINEATDGNSILLRLDNDLANSAGSTNETAQLRFGFGSDEDVVRIVAGKQDVFTSNATSDAILSFNVDASGVSTEVMRLWGIESVANPSSSFGMSIGTPTIIGDSTLYVIPNESGSRSILTKGFSQTCEQFQVDDSNTTTIGDSTCNAGTHLIATSLHGSDLSIQGNVDGTNRTYGPATIYFVTGSGTPDYTVTMQISDRDVLSTTFPNSKFLLFDFEDVNSVATEQPSVMFVDNSTRQIITLTSGATIGTNRSYQFSAPTINGVAGGSTETITNAATFYIDAAPSGSNITFTNGPYALWVDAGAVRIDDSLTVGSIDTGGGTALELGGGVWTPTTNNIANLDSSSAAEGQYLRVGNTVTSSIQLTVDPTVANTSTQLELDLPVTSNFGATSDAAGSCGSPDLEDEVGAIRADTASDELEVLWVTNSAASHELNCSFSYQVI